MRIQGEESVRAAQVPASTPVSGQAGGGEQAGGSQGSSPAATVDFSSQAQTIQNAKAAVDATPDVREGLVNSLKQKIDSGNYHVSSSDIADMMLRRSSADQVK